MADDGNDKILPSLSPLVTVGNIVSKAATGYSQTLSPVPFNRHLNVIGVCSNIGVVGFYILHWRTLGLTIPQEDFRDGNAILGKDGKIQNKNSFGNDPVPPHDKRH